MIELDNNGIPQVHLSAMISRYSLPLVNLIKQTLQHCKILVKSVIHFMYKNVRLCVGVFVRLRVLHISGGRLITLNKKT